MVNYANGKIYKIVANGGDEIYVGSTTKKYLSQRMDNHRSAYKCWKQGKAKKVMVYDIFDKYGTQNCAIIFLENYPCETKDELHAKEAEYIKSTANCINKYIPNNYNSAGSEQNYNKKYYEEKSETIKEQTKQYYNDHKVQMQVKQKEYATINRDNIKLYQKQYRYEKYTCACGSIISLGEKSRHKKSKKHQKYIDGL